MQRECVNCGEIRVPNGSSQVGSGSDGTMFEPRPLENPEHPEFCPRPNGDASHIRPPRAIPDGWSRTGPRGAAPLLARISRRARPSCLQGPRTSANSGRIRRRRPGRCTQAPGGADKLVPQRVPGDIVEVPGIDEVVLEDSPAKSSRGYLSGAESGGTGTKSVAGLERLGHSRNRVVRTTLLKVPTGKNQCTRHAHPLAHDRLGSMPLSGERMLQHIPRELVGEIIEHRQDKLLAVPDIAADERQLDSDTFAWLDVLLHRPAAPARHHPGPRRGRRRGGYPGRCGGRAGGGGHHRRRYRNCGAATRWTVPSGPWGFGFRHPRTTIGSLGMELAASCCVPCPASRSRNDAMNKPRRCLRADIDILIQRLDPGLPLPSSLIRETRRGSARSRGRGPGAGGARPGRDRRGHRAARRVRGG